MSTVAFGGTNDFAERSRRVSSSSNRSTTPRYLPVSEQSPTTVVPGATSHARSIVAPRRTGPGWAETSVPVAKNGAASIRKATSLDFTWASTVKWFMAAPNFDNWKLVVESAVAVVAGTVTDAGIATAGDVAFGPATVPTAESSEHATIINSERRTVTLQIRRDALTSKLRNSTTGLQRRPFGASRTRSIVVHGGS